MHRTVIGFLAVILCLPLVAAAPALAAGQQQSNKGRAKSAKPDSAALQLPRPAGETDEQRMELVRATMAREFGTHLKISPKYEPMFGDFDGDGVEDLAVVVTGKPMLDQAAQNYKVIDPYDEFFGYGDPKIMMSFPVQVEDQARYVAVAHSWRAAHPKAKFVIVNLPFEKIEVSSARVKKKLINALYATDITGIQAQVFWDGRKYKWVAVGSGD